jgi:hypothetical protein
MSKMGMRDRAIPPGLTKGSPGPGRRAISGGRHRDRPRRGETRSGVTVGTHLSSTRGRNDLSSGGARFGMGQGSQIPGVKGVVGS